MSFAIIVQQCKTKQNMFCVLHSKSSFLTLFFVFVFPSVQSDSSDLNRAFFNSQSSGYIYPQPPAQFDEPSLPPIYLPPLPPIFSDDVPILPTPYPPPLSYLPPSSHPVYLPPPNDPSLGAQLHPSLNDDSVVVPAASPQNEWLYPPSQVFLPPHFKIENMSCTQGINFRATFKMARELPQFPFVDDATDGCIRSLNSNLFKIDLEDFNSMLKCGVRRCKNSVARLRNDASQGGENMCVVLRIPMVRGVRLPEDEIVTLVCTPQERVVIQTRHVKLGTNKIFQSTRGRSTNGFIAAGGSQKDLKSRIGIFRKRSGTNIFDQNVQPDSVIHLGEDLVMRAVINDGDGWTSSQIGPVIITGLNSKKSALLVNQNGCVNPIMKSICPQQPQKINPLSTELHFRAFLFQEAPQGDEMVVSVRMHGCLHMEDCIKTESCSDNVSSTIRTKREIMDSNNASDKNNNENINNFRSEAKDWESQLTFRVEPFLTKSKTSTFVYSEDQENLYLFYPCLIGSIVFSCLGITLIVWYLYSKKNKI